MKLNSNTILPILITLGGGMAIGSLHNAMARGRIPSPIGYVFIASVFLVFVGGLMILSHYQDKSATNHRTALIWAIVVAVLGILNVLTTLSDPNAASMLFHEYLIPITGLLQTGKLFTERSSA